MEQAVSFCHVFLLVWTLDSGLWTLDSTPRASTAPLEPRALRAPYRVPRTRRLDTSLDAGASVPVPRSSVLCPWPRPSPPVPPIRFTPDTLAAGLHPKPPLVSVITCRVTWTTRERSLTPPRYASSHAGLVESMTMVFTKRPSQHRSPPNHAPHRTTSPDTTDDTACSCSSTMDSTTRALSPLPLAVPSLYPLSREKEKKTLSGSP